METERASGVDMLRAQGIAKGVIVTPREVTLTAGGQTSMLSRVEMNPSATSVAPKSFSLLHFCEIRLQ